MRLWVAQVLLLIIIAVEAEALMIIAYGVSWDGDTTTAASKNALYDKIETIASGGKLIPLVT